MINNCGTMAGMNIRDLKYLVALADYQHFGKAAEACYVSQPALSMQIKKLEETLGVLLVERNSKQIFLSDTGKRIVQQARDILCRLDTLKAIANQAKDPFSGELHIGIIPTLAPYLLPRIMPKLSALFPKLTLYLIEDITANLLSKIAEGKLDAAILALPVEGVWVRQPLFEEDFVLAVSKEHPLSRKGSVNLADLENKSLLFLEDGHCLRDQTLAVCQQSRAFEYKKFRATSLETLRYMVASGVGITLMPRLACRVDDGIHYLPIKAQTPKRNIGMIWRDSSIKDILLQNMAKEIQDQFFAQINIV